MPIGVRTFIALIAESVTAFVATNVDDLAVLLLLFASGARLGTVIAGQYAGFAAILGASAIASAAALVLPAGWAAWLGLVPFTIGLRALFRRGDDDDDVARASRPGAALSSVATVAAVTLANGGDNIAVYAALFARRAIAEIAVVTACFAVLVLALVIATSRIARLPPVARAFETSVRSAQAHRLTPWLLMALGAAILVEGLWRSR